MRMFHTPLGPQFWPAPLVWSGFACAIWWLDGRWQLGHLALLLVLGCTVASIWLSATASVLASAVAVTAFNWFLVPPRFTLHVQLHEDALLLVTLLGTSTLISLLTSKLRLYAQIQTEQAQEAERLHQLASQLQHAPDVEGQRQVACRLLGSWFGVPVTLWLNGESPSQEDPARAAWQASQHEVGAIGPGTGRHESLPILLLPVRAGVHRVGTLMLGSTHPVTAWPERAQLHLQALVRLLGDELQRRQSALHALESQQVLQSQELRNTLLAAISHDYRTPLATIASAASGLLDVPLASVRAAGRTICEETEQLNRMTSTILQMARLDKSSAPLNPSWESAEELLGVVLAGVRRRHPQRDIQTLVLPGLPLLWCDPVLVVQLLDNLVENALRYSPEHEKVDLQALSHEDGVVLQVLDHGPGIPVHWREKVFNPFVRALPQAQADSGFGLSHRRGMGLGLALCQAITRLHQGQLWIDDRPGGGTVVRLKLPTRSHALSVPEVGE